MATVSQVDRKVAAALRRAGLANGNKTLVIGVSGGADSSTLLYSLNQLGKTCDIGLHVCHLNHDFRGEEADEDARFVESLARELGLPCTVEKRDPIAYQREQGISSFEQGAREMRYEFMSGVAHQVGATAVAVGHTSDDLAETILLHILRGAGLHGLRGMTELAPWPWPAGLETPVLFRPLLEVSKSQTVEYCRELGRAYRQDSGNLLFRFTRNRVRRELMPLLAEEYNPRVSDALVRLANSTSLDLDYLETELDRAWPGLLAAPSSLRHVSEDVPEVVLKRESLSNLHPALQRMALRRAYVTVKGDARRLSERHLISMMELAAGGKKPGTLDLPSQVALNVTAEEVAVSIRNKQGRQSPGRTGKPIFALLASGCWRSTACSSRRLENRGGNSNPRPIIRLDPNQWLRSLHGPGCVGPLSYRAHQAAWGPVSAPGHGQGEEVAGLHGRRQGTAGMERSRSFGISGRQNRMGGGISHRRVGQGY